MPLQRRLPKRGFKSHLLKFNAEVTLSELEQLGLAEVDLDGFGALTLNTRSWDVMKGREQVRLRRDLPTALVRAPRLAAATDWPSISMLTAIMVFPLRRVTIP